MVISMMVNRKKTIQKKIGLYLGLVLFLTVITNVLTYFSLDVIWNFGFSSNIANHRIPYRDFNMVIGPFYNVFVAGLMKIFGNRYFSFNLINSMIVSFFLIFVFDQLKWKTFFLILFLLSMDVTYGYNSFCAFLVLGIFLLSESKNPYREHLIGLSIGLIFMTKHNIGLLFLLFYVLIHWKEKRLWFMAFLPLLFGAFYLILNHAFFAYIEFCYLGLGSFLSNFQVHPPVLVTEIFVVGWLCYELYRTKKIGLCYLILFQSLLFPIFDQNHFMTAMIPVIYYYLSTDRNKILFLFFLLCFSLLSFRFFVLKIPEVIVPSSIFQNTTLRKKQYDYLVHMTDYIKEKEEEYDVVYLFVSDAYLLRLYMGETPSSYDLIHRGNLGLQKEDMIDRIDQTCTTKRCLFFLDSSFFDAEKEDLQLDLSFKEYVLENYSFLDVIPSGDYLYGTKKSG